MRGPFLSTSRSKGDSYIVLKDVRLRCTLSPQDSANLPARKPLAYLTRSGKRFPVQRPRLAVLDYYAHVLLEPSPEQANFWL